MRKGAKSGAKRGEILAASMTECGMLASKNTPPHYTLRPLGQEMHKILILSYRTLYSTRYLTSLYYLFATLETCYVNDVI